MEVLKATFKDRILQITFGVALFSLFFSHLELSDINWQTIISLFALMLIIQVFQKLKLLDYCALLLLRYADTQRKLVQLLVLLTFIGSMILTNDVGIITMVPLAVSLGKKAGIKMTVPVVLITLAANLGSLITPIGNPQNLFLLAHYHLNAIEFFKMSLPLGVISGGLLWGWSLRIPTQKLKLNPEIDYKINKLAVSGTVVILAFVMVGIFGILPLWLGLGLALGWVFLLDNQLFKKIDYALLLTFCGFFIAVGNFSRISAVDQLLTSLGSKQHLIYLASLGLSQLISNVPAAILLAPFSKISYPLFLGVSIGGLGTLVASLANLLAYKQYQRYQEKGNQNFLKQFSLINFSSLCFLGIAGWLLLYFS
ncbi:MAG: SLC13 family permease [Liquorilactobacillus nagelii]|uniref:SLC13 family permease n=1 Tax=Liquorilactobacillus nagelii TaxID=82688 RepID=UPI0039EBC7DA